MKIAVVGPGAIGCLWGGFLSLSGQEVWFLDKDSQRARYLEKTGIRIESINGQHKAKVKFSADPQVIGRADLVIVCVKSYDTLAAMEKLAGLLEENTPVLTLQNGLGNAEIISQHIGAEKTLVGVTSQGATLLEAGHIRHAGCGPTIIGWVSRGTGLRNFDQDLVLKQIVDVFSKAGFETERTDNVEELIWSKLITNVGINALTAITRLNNGRLVEFEYTRTLMSQAIKEAVSVAYAKRIKLSRDPITQAEEVCRATCANISSMLQDVLHKKKTEIDAINGAVVKEADRLKLSAPVNQTLTDLVKVIESSYSFQVSRY